MLLINSGCMSNRLYFLIDRQEIHAKVGRSGDPPYNLRTHQSLSNKQPHWHQHYLDMIDLPTLQPAEAWSGEKSQLKLCI